MCRLLLEHLSHCPHSWAWASLTHCDPGVLSPLPGAMTPWHGHLVTIISLWPSDKCDQSIWLCAVKYYPRIITWQTVIAWEWKSVTSSQLFTPNHLGDGSFSLILQVMTNIDHFLCFCLPLLETLVTLTGDTPGWLWEPWFRFSPGLRNIVMAAVCSELLQSIYKLHTIIYLVSCSRDLEPDDHVRVIMEFMLWALRCCAE